MPQNVLKFKRTVLFIFIYSVAKISTFKEFSHNSDAESSPDATGSPVDKDQSIHNGKIMLLGDNSKLLSQDTGISLLNQVSTQSSSKKNEISQLNVVDDDIVVLDEQSEIDKNKEFKRFKHKETHLWDLKNYKDARIEPGFDLTREEIRKFKIWKNGVIPYYIDVVSFDKVFRDKIRNFLQITNAATSLNFIELPSPPANDDERWVFFINRRGLLQCADHTVKNFTDHGVQQVVLGYDCVATKGELAEAVMSIAGVPAQHNAPDRDDYVKVNLENIMPDKRYLFEKLKDDEWLFHDLEYDFDSATHYDIHKYSAQGRVTIELKDNLKDFEPGISYSFTDLLKLNILYNYITRNNNLQQQKCEKLYRGPNKFERLVPNGKMEKPRKKPSRYIGIPDNEENSNDNYIVQEDKENKLNKEQETETEFQESVENEDSNIYRDKNEEEQTTDVTVGGRYIKNKEPTKGKTNLALSDKISEKNIKLKDNTYTKQSLSFSNAYKKVKIISPNRQKHDPLYLLSDYQTGEETDRKEVLKHIEAKTILNYSGT